VTGLGSISVEAGKERAVGDDSQTKVDDGSAYAIANLRELEDLAKKFGLSPAMETHFAREPLGCEQSGLSLQRLAPNARQPFGHRHETEEELYVVVDGSGRVKLDDEVRDLRAWDALRVSPGVTRTFEASAEGMEFLAFGASGLGIGDVESVEGAWSD
jgi:mannose-6-phosphate isomerase-like protein (cupin superfamily)